MLRVAYSGLAGNIRLNCSDVWLGSANLVCHSGSRFVLRKCLSNHCTNRLGAARVLRFGYIIALPANLTDVI